MIGPDDVQMVTGGSEERRTFIDTILAQLQPEYLHQLIAYNKVLQQRNGFLKAAAQYNRFDVALLDVLDEQLAETGQEIFTARKVFLEAFIEIVRKEYFAIASDNDAISITYDSQLINKTFPILLKENRQRDLYLQRTGCGVHKDDLEMKMKEQSFKTVASQGQRKSLLFALKLAEYAIIKQYKGFAPVLLLDDVFEKLDASRMQKLLNKVCTDGAAQIFITDTHKERLETAFKELSVEYDLIELF
jgi:DNA replication and repair protein RecF